MNNQIANYNNNHNKKTFTKQTPNQNSSFYFYFQSKTNSRFNQLSKNIAPRQRHHRFIGTFRNEDNGDTYNNRCTYSNRGTYKNEDNGGTYSNEDNADNGGNYSNYHYFHCIHYRHFSMIELLLRMCIYKKCRWRKAEENTTNSYSD